MTDHSLLQLINNDKWDTIINNYGKEDLGKFITNGNAPVHIACANKSKKFIKYISSTFPELLSKSNKDGNTCLHLMAMFGEHKLLQELLLNNPENINLVNNNYESVFYLLLDDSYMFDWVLTNEKLIKYVNIDSVTGTNMTPLLYFINKSENSNDIYFKNFKKLYEFGAKINIPEFDPPLCFATKMNKIHIVKFLLKNKENPNITTVNKLSPTILATMNENYNLLKLLLHNGANINYSGPDSNHNLLSISLMTGNMKIANMLLDKKIELNTPNKYMNTPLHIALESTDKIPADILFKMIYNGDINAQNINGITPLQLLLKKNIWKNYRVALQNKDMNISFKNNKERNILSYVQKSEILDFLNIIADSVINKSYYENGKSLPSNRELLRRQIRKKLLRNYNSNNSNEYEPANNTDKTTQTNYDKNEIVLSPDEIKNTPEFGLFNSDILHNVIYTVIILKKYKNVICPFMYYDDDKYTNDKININLLNLFKSTSGNSIYELVGTYTEFFYELSPYLIIWSNKNESYIHPDLSFYVQKCIIADNIRFIFFKLTLIPENINSIGGGSHANIIIFDKKYGTLERFEPFGNIKYLDSEELDLFITRHIGKFFTKFLKKHNKKLIYLAPSTYLENVSFQGFSNDNDISVRKLGDPQGYCLAWTYWYLELRINNPDEYPSDLIKKSLKQIINTSYGKDSTFIDFIRKYSRYLDDEKNKFLLESGIAKDRLYNLNMTKKEQDKIVSHIKEKFTQVVNEKLR